MSSDSTTPLSVGRYYSVRVRPFNIADVFYVNRVISQPPYIISKNRFNVLFSADINNAVSNVTYTLIKNTNGPVVDFVWNYGSTSKYRIVISLTDSYNDYNPIEYEIDGNTNSSFEILDLPTDVNERVYFSIPDINTNPNLYLRAGRSYKIGITALKTILDSNDAIVYVPSDKITINNIIPFTYPLRPVSVYAFGNKDKIRLSVLIPNFINDPNYYVTDGIINYYKYHSILVEYSNAANVSLEWQKVQVNVEGSGNFFETWQSFDINNLINDSVSYNIRVGMQIYNNYNNQYALSEYTYPTRINNISYNDSFGNTIYPSIYPYKPSLINNFLVYKVSASNNKIGMTWQTPLYNGNAEKYKYDIYYLNSQNNWVDVYDNLYGIANMNDNINDPSSLTEPNISINFILTCKIVINYKYNLRISATGYYGTSFSTDKLNPNVNRRAISDFSVASIIYL
jgi:hypothetical protein